jgi:hypothetical protein
MQPVVRSLAAAVLAAVSLSCVDHGVGLERGSRLAKLPVAPVFLHVPEGGPAIEIATIRAVLRRESSGDSSVAIAEVAGDSAVLEFENVVVTGEETTFQLSVQAFDENGVLIFSGSEEITLKPGENEVAAPGLEYTAPDATVSAIDIRVGTTSVPQFNLQWAGAAPGNTSCLNRAADPTAVTQQQLTVVGVKADQQTVPNVRVGWTSLDTAVATVDENGLVTARCSNKSTKIIARTFLDKADTIKVIVTAPPFTLLMSPEVAAVPRGTTKQFSAVLVDENGNQTTTSTVNWSSSDAERATVSATGLVTAIANGRVLITASSGDRTTVGVVEVVPPLASRVEITPSSDQLNTGQRRVYSAAAFEANGERIFDASGFDWRSTNTSVVQVSSSGSVFAAGAGVASVIVTLDGKSDTAVVQVTQSTTGQVAGRVLNAATGGPVVSASITGGVTTDANGRFTSGQLTPPSSITVSATGLATFTYFNLPIQLGQITELGDLQMAPAGGTGSLTGTVVNALDDAAVSGATVQIFAGINAPETNPVIGSTTTDLNGAFTLSAVASGTYTLVVGRSGFSKSRTTAVVVGGAARDNRVPLSPTLAGTGIRVVLSWGDCVANQSVPCDLDSHLTGPASAPDEGRFHVAYFNDAYVSGTDSVGVLDNDATSGLGPETITLRQKASGVYKYYVHNYSAGTDTTSTALSNSAQARVQVYQGSTLVATFVPPTGQQGTLWAVFQVEGANLLPVNQILKLQDFSEVPADFMRVGSTPDSDLQRLVAELQRRRTKTR